MWHSADCQLQVRKVHEDHVVRTEQTVHPVSLVLPETRDSVAIQDLEACVVLPAGLEFRVLAALMELQVLAVLLVQRDSLDILEEQGQLAMQDSKVSRELPEFRELQDLLVCQAIPVSLESKDL